MLRELIDKFYSDREKAKNRPQTRFYITDAGKCQRAVFFKLKGAPREEIEGRVLRMFDHGDYIHQLILKTLFGLGLVRASEINIPPQAIISGRADAIISLNNELYVLDIKSMNSFVFKALAEPKDDDINQVQLYLHFFNVLKGVILYVNKDTQDLKEFFFDYQPDLAKALLDGLENLKVKIDINKVPDRLSDYPENYQCQYCQFRELCFLAGSGEKEWEEFKTKLKE